MSTFYTFDLSGETTDEEIHTEDEDETWDDAFRPEVQEMTPVKKTNAETTTDLPASSRRRTPSSRRRTPTTPSKSVSSSSSRRRRTTPNVFDGISKEIESELRRCSNDPCESISSVADVKNEGDEIVLVVQNEQHKRIHVRTTTHAPFQSLFEKYRTYAEGQGWIKRGARLSFLLDDERIEVTETPASLDCQTDDIIDVIILPT